MTKQEEMSDEQERRMLIQRLCELLRTASAQKIRLVLITTHGILGK